MDKGDEIGPDPGDSAAEAVDPTEAERRELSRRSEAHRRKPDEAIPLEDALQDIERSLGY